MSDTKAIGIIRTKDTETNDLVCDRCEQGWRVYVKPTHKSTMPHLTVKVGQNTTMLLCPELVKAIMKLNTHIRCNACGGGLLQIPQHSRFDKNNLLKILNIAKGFVDE